RDFTGGPEHEDAVHPAGHEVVDEGGDARRVDLAGIRARGQQRGDDSVEVSHGRFLACRGCCLTPRRTWRPARRVWWGRGERSHRGCRRWSAAGHHGRRAPEGLLVAGWGG